MTLYNFENSIRPIILMRGQDYYNDHAVKELNEQSPGEWEATVEGTEEYNVEISLEGNEISSWFCDCPYDGDICKHVVATLYAIRDIKESIETQSAIPDITFTENTNSILDNDDNCVEETDRLKNILSNTSNSKLIAFICKYAASHKELKDALLQEFTPKINTEELSVDYKSKINQCFDFVPRRKSYSRYYSDFEDDINPYEISSKLTTYFNKAKFLFDQKSFGDAASIALHILRNIGERYEENMYYQYDDNFPFSTDCNIAGELLLDIVQHPEVAVSLKEKIVKEVRVIAQIKAFYNYGIYEIDELLQTINLHAQTKENALLLIDELLLEQNNSYKLDSLVNQKIELLYQLNRNEEAQHTITKYLYLPEIRQSEVKLLISTEQYDKALAMLDEGIEVATKNNTRGTINQWKQEKLKIYRLQNDIPNIINTARELFINGRDCMEYYHILRKYVAANEWKDFLKIILQKANLHASFGYSVEADIYIEEKNNDMLMAFLRKVSEYDLSFMIKYAHHLKHLYSEEILTIYSNKIQEYAEKNIGRNHYEHVTSVLKEMLKFNGGKKVVDTLVNNFRTRYKRRPAMMENLKGF